MFKNKTLFSNSFPNSGFQSISNETYRISVVSWHIQKTGYTSHSHFSSKITKEEVVEYLGSKEKQTFTSHPL